MNEPVLVSIVTPVYNQAEFLGATIESVLAQDYPALEYIVIDDGSSDESLAVAQRYAAAYPGRVSVHTQANVGQATTLNRGWAMSRGQILAYLSSDDCLCPTAVSTLVKALDDHPSAAVAYCDFWLIDAKGVRLREVRTENFDERRLCVDLVCQPGAGALFRRTVFEQVGGWQPGLHQVPDFEFWLRAVRMGEFVRVPERLSEYRIHEGQASFAIIPYARAEEIVGVMEAFWSTQAGALQGERAIARALAIASKHHAQSGRVIVALRRFLQALIRHPALALDAGIWRQLVVGFVRRTFFRLKGSTRLV
ncbi:glycosyltransferase family 2 protein [Paucibacter sp. PLA-PC-4]|uniref:glycosyltransferase family 2 protein n=1 Tax=Paucibacter sp. PLA-PC-4 TaxID=2993655 RepID=UPI00224AF3F9|nr:glycosyltransferase family 2 protein [Paucibacter sp. PLA-PC-4]MCX2865128.1 glycosyltransferase family 2 protein [Paucibacter sp. PLA-PC-4]